MRIQIELNEKATELWNKVTDRPEFGASTKAGIVYALMHSYLNPPTHYTTAPTAKKEETPAKGKVELRKEREAALEREVRDAKIEIGLDRARAGLVSWPILEDFCNMFCFPGSYGLGDDPNSDDVYEWTPPDDYPQHLKDEWPVKIKKRKDFELRMAGITDPRPEIYHEEGTPEGNAERAALAEWSKRNPEGE